MTRRTKIIHYELQKCRVGSVLSRNTSREHENEILDRFPHLILYNSNPFAMLRSKNMVQQSSLETRGMTTWLVTAISGMGFGLTKMKIPKKLRQNIKHLHSFYFTFFSFAYNLSNLALLKKEGGRGGTFQAENLETFLVIILNRNLILSKFHVHHLSKLYESEKRGEREREEEEETGKERLQGNSDSKLLSYASSTDT